MNIEVWLSLVVFARTLAVRDAVRGKKAPRSKLLGEKPIKSFGHRKSKLRSSAHRELRKNANKQFNILYRGVAQFGRALRSGRRGRGFKSRHLDQLKASTRKLLVEVLFINFIIAFIKVNRRRISAAVFCYAATSGALIFFTLNWLTAYLFISQSSFLA